MIDILIGLMVVVHIGCFAFILYKNLSVRENRDIIWNAIFEYQIWATARRKYIEVDFTDMESFEDTYDRLFDWGYDHILPPDKYEIVKPFIRCE